MEDLKWASKASGHSLARLEHFCIFEVLSRKLAILVGFAVAGCPSKSLKSLP
jgi:hypothetical protein